MKGSTIKRGNTWTAYWFTTDPATGKRRQHSKGGFRIQKDARAHLNSIMEAVHAGAWKPDTKLTVRQLLEDHWLASKRAEGLRPSTASLYRRAISTWLVPHIGGLDVRQLTPATVAELVEKLRTSGSRTANPCRLDRRRSPSGSSSRRPLGRPGTTCSAETRSSGTAARRSPRQ